jgi:type IV secretory pathway VirJ component
VRRCAALLLALALGVGSVAAHAADMLAHGRFTQVAVYRPAGEVKQFVLFLSGEKAGGANITEAAVALAHEGAMVALVNTPELLASLEADAASCTFPDGDLENLSRYLQAYYRLPTYMTPILIGYSAGGTLAYAMLAQAPADLFAGAVSLQFCRALPLTHALCAGTQLAATPGADRKGVELHPATALQVPWVAVQIAGEGACAAPLTQEFVNAVPHAELRLLPAPGHAWRTTASWLPELISGYQKIAAQRLAEAPPPASLADLPIIEMHAGGANDLFAVFLSGDGGWAGIDKHVAAALVARGISVAGVDSLRYWTARTPPGLAADLDRILRYYAFRWKKKRALIIGYSQGADVLPFAINRLPAATRRRVVLAAMLGLDDSADFEFHLSSWVMNGESGLPVRPELDKLAIPAALCIYGDDDADSLCPHLLNGRVKIVKLSGGHHFNGDYDAVAQVVVAAAAIRARAN